MLHDHLELTGRRLHPGVRVLHCPAGVGAGPTGDLAQLVGDLLLSRAMSVRTNFALARSSPPTRATHDSVTALIASRPPSRSNSDVVSVVVCFPLPRMCFPLPRLVR